MFSLTDSLSTCTRVLVRIAISTVSECWQMVEYEYFLAYMKTNISSQLSSPCQSFWYSFLLYLRTITVRARILSGVSLLSFGLCGSSNKWERFREWHQQIFAVILGYDRNETDISKDLKKYTVWIFDIMRSNSSSRYWRNNLLLIRASRWILRNANIELLFLDRFFLLRNTAENLPK